MQLLSAPEGPSRVARDASPWFVRRIHRKPRRGEINLRCGVFDAAPPGLRAGRRLYPGPYGPGYTISPLRGWLLAGDFVARYQLHNPLRRGGLGRGDFELGRALCSLEWATYLRLIQSLHPRNLTPSTTTPVPLNSSGIYRRRVTPDKAKTPSPNRIRLPGSGDNTTCEAETEGIQVAPPSIDNSVNTSKKLSMR